LGAAALVPFVEKKPAISWYHGFPVAEGHRAATPDGESLEVSLGSPIFAAGRLRRLFPRKQDARVADEDALIEAEALDAGWVEIGLMKDMMLGGGGFERVYARDTGRVEEVRAFFPSVGDTMMFSFYSRPLPLLHRRFPIAAPDGGSEQEDIDGGERITTHGGCETDEPAIWGWRGTQALRHPHAMGWVRGADRVEVEAIDDTCQFSFFP
jgi:hypothetical protein